MVPCVDLGLIDYVASFCVWKDSCIDYDDIKQMGYFGYHKSKDTNNVKYIMKAIRTAIIDELRKITPNDNRRRWNKFRYIMSIDEPLYGEDHTLLDVYGVDDENYDMLEVNDLKNRLIAILNSLEVDAKKIIYDYYFVGKTMLQIGNELGISESAIFYRHKKLIKHIKKMLEN